MKCGHPDVMGNLYWHIQPRRKNYIENGGSWECQTCSRERVRKYRYTPAGIKAGMRHKAKQRGSN